MSKKNKSGNNGSQSQTANEAANYSGAQQTTDNMQNNNTSNKRKK